MRAAILAGVLLIPIYATAGEPAPERAEPTWAVFAETMLNSESNVEAAIGAEVGRWFVEARARDAAYTTAQGAACRTITCRIGEGEALEYEARTGLTFRRNERIAHGPVLNYIERADGRETWAAGWRIQIGSE